MLCELYHQRHFCVQNSKSKVCFNKPSNLLAGCLRRQYVLRLLKEFLRNILKIWNYFLKFVLKLEFLNLKGALCSLGFLQSSMCSMSYILFSSNGLSRISDCSCCFIGLKMRHKVFNWFIFQFFLDYVLTKLQNRTFSKTTNQLCNEEFLNQSNNRFNHNIL